jgi:hypothetical protein
LRLADAHRKPAGKYMARVTNTTADTSSPAAVGHNMERAFIEFARAATLIVK